MILGKSTGTLTSRQEHSLINSLHVSTKPIKSIYNAYNYNFAAHFNIAYKEYMYLHVTLKTPKHLWWKLSLHNKKIPYCYMYYLDHLSRFIALSDR